MTCQPSRAALLAVTLVLAGPALAGPLDEAQDAVDPDCTAAKAARDRVGKATGPLGGTCAVGAAALSIS